jgi:hypothetical protein
LATFDVLLCADFARFHVLEMTSEGRLEQAAAGAADLLRKHVDYAANARTVVQQLIGLSMVQADLNLAMALSRWSEPSALAPLQREVASLQLETVRWENAMMGEYLWITGAIDNLAAEPGACVLTMTPASSPDTGGLVCRSQSLLLDESATIRELNVIFAPVREGRAIDKQGYTRGFGWWFENATGKLALSMVTSSGAPHLCTGLLESRDTTLALHARVLSKLGSGAK